MKILIIGPPACGKDTLAALLSKKISLNVITPGILLRSIPKSSQNYYKINKVMSAGGLVDPKFVGRMLLSESTKPDYQNGFILNGWFRQPEDKKYFDPGFDKVIYLNISKETAIKRTMARRICEANGHTYNFLTNNTKVDGKCDYDGSKLIQRQDDKLVTLTKRYEIFQTKTLKVIDFFRKKGILTEIDAEGTPDQVLERVLSKAQL